MRLGIVANMYRPGFEAALETLARWAQLGSHEVVYEKALHGLIDRAARTCAPEDVAHDAQMVVALGGDGTMLRAARLVGSAAVPVLGVNLGSLGFLTQVTPPHLDLALTRLAKGDYITESRSVLSIKVRDQAEPLFAFNEVTLDRGQQSRAIELKLEADGNLVCWYVADGLIVATPTGSTAYALSAGGPVAMPELKAFIVAPVAAHTLAQRPIVVSEDTLLRVTNEEPNVNAFVNVDGRASAELASGEACDIRKADFSLQLVRFPEEDFFSLVRAKLGWESIRDMHTETDAWYKRTYNDPLYLTLYEEGDSAVAGEEARAAAALLAVSAGCRWLDVCCGFGRHVEALSGAGYESFGVDQSSLLIRRAHDRGARQPSRARYVRGELRHLPFARHFDVVTCFFDSFGYLPREVDHLDALLAMGRVLQPGGLLLMQLTNREHLLSTWPPPTDEMRRGYAIHKKWWLDLEAGRYGWQQRMRRGSEERHWTFDLALFSAHELTAMLRQAGFHQLVYYGNLQGTPYSLSSPQLIVVARKSVMADVPPLSP